MKYLYSRSLPGAKAPEPPKPKKKGHWKVVVNHEKAGIEPILGLVEGKIPLLKSHSILVVHD